MPSPSPLAATSACRALVAVAALSLGLLGCSLGASAQTASAPEIGFVRLLFTEGGVTVLDVSTRPGHLKQRRGGAAASGPVQAGQLLTEARVEGGAPHWAEVIEDPLLERRESVNDRGELETVFIRRDEAEVTVRIPAIGARQTLTFTRAPEPTGEGGGAAAPVVWHVEVTV